MGCRLGNWLTAEQARTLWQLPDPTSLKGKRDRAILAVLLGCGLRRRELTELTVDHFQRREDHWAIVDLIGKAGHVRTVPVPTWVKETIEDWLKAADITNGRLFRCVCRAGTKWGTEMTEKVVWHVVKQYAGQVGILKLAPHDLRRSCARLCHGAGGELEQIQFLLGHVSVQTTEKYLGCKQRLREAVNDQIGIEPGSEKMCRIRPIRPVDFRLGPSWRLQAQREPGERTWKSTFMGTIPVKLCSTGTLAKIVQQAWEMGESELTLIHGHGRNRGISPGFVNTNTGYFGLCIRQALRNDRSLRRWVKYTTLEGRTWGSTSIRLKVNPSPTRKHLDCL